VARGHREGRRAALRPGRAVHQGPGGLRGRRRVARERRDSARDPSEPQAGRV